MNIGPVTRSCVCPVCQAVQTSVLLQARCGICHSVFNLDATGAVTEVVTAAQLAAMRPQVTPDRALLKMGMFVFVRGVLHGASLAQRRDWLRKNAGNAA